ncbi:MAG: FkbM family methyltransferase [Armatimonadetes bacterium]|nr:FkbM family methyltransferase [Armatimonadota bacterium]
MRLRDMILLRPALRRLPVRISGGPNMGLRWSLTTRRAFRRGCFEQSRVDVITRLAEGCACFWDVGAHFGYISLAASRRVTAGGHVVAIECNQDNLFYLRSHIHWNRITNVSVVACAIADQPGTAWFVPASSGTGFVAQERNPRAYGVPATSVDALVAIGTCPPPSAVKVDIDHNHVDFIRGARETLVKHPVILTLATNNSEEYHRQAAVALRSMGYTVYSPRRCDGPRAYQTLESELLAVGPGRTVADEIVQAFLRS